MTPITFDSMSQLKKLTIYSDDDRLCVAYITKISDHDKLRAIGLLSECIAITLGILILSIISCSKISGIYNITWQNAIISILTLICGLFIFDALSLYPIIKDVKELAKSISNGYKIEVITIDDIALNYEKTNIFIKEDGFYNERYDSVIDELFSLADSIYNKDEILKIEMED